MPIYEYECSNCKFYVEALQKISEAPLKQCPSCKKQTLKRLVSAPVFRLKGGGWYETDFKSDQEGKRNLAGGEEAPAAKADDKAAADQAAKPAESVKDADKKPAAAASKWRPLRQRLLRRRWHVRWIDDHLPLRPHAGALAADRKLGAQGKVNDAALAARHRAEAEWNAGLLDLLGGRQGAEPQFLHSQHAVVVGIETDERVILGGRAQHFEREVFEREQEDAIQQALEQLPEQERRIISARFGTGGRPARTLRDAAREVGVSQEQARRLEARALERLSSDERLASWRAAA